MELLMYENVGVRVFFLRKLYRGKNTAPRNETVRIKR